MDLAIVAAALIPALGIGSVALGASRVVDGPGPIFKQNRRGKDGKHFTIYKIRTMISLDDDSEAKGIEEEVTTLGKLLRPAAVDELPQLLNVLKGNMTVAGPRPTPDGEHIAMERALEDHPEIYIPWKEQVYPRKPGMVALSCIVDRLNRRKIPIEHVRKGVFDLYDTENASFRYDLTLLNRALGMCARKLIFDRSVNGTPQPEEV